MRRTRGGVPEREAGGMGEHLSDGALLERFARRGEQEAFALLVRRHGPRVRAACRRVLASEHDAEDVAQLTFLVLARKAGEVAWRGSVGGWLCGVARRLSLNARAALARRGMPAAAGGAPIPDTPDPWADPPAEAMRRELRGLLERELNLLPATCRDAVVLCDLEGMTHGEAADRLGWPTGSVSRRLGRGRELLRRRLAGRALPVAIVLVGGLVLALRPRGPVGPTGPARGAVRGAMAALAARGQHAGTDPETLLRRLARGDRAGLDPGEALALARDAGRLAARVGPIDPGRDRAAWRAYAGDLSRAALGLERAARNGDAPALLASARRARESCVRCHLAFREGGTTFLTE